MTEFAFEASLKNVLARLDELPDKIQENIVRGALRAAAKPLLEAAKRNVPDASGNLRDSIRISSSFDRRSGEIRTRVKAGRKRGPFYAPMIEFGTQPHTIKGPVVLNGKVYRNIKHPGARPNGFMRRAFDSSGDAVVQAYADYMRTRLDKELAKLGPR